MPVDPNAPISTDDRRDIVGLTADVVSAYLSKNAIAAGEIENVIAPVHAAFSSLGQPAAPAAPTYEPAVPIRKSITPDALISLIDSRPYKVLKRHLTRHGLTMEAYRERYGLPYDYPAAAATYSARRSELAKAAGFGQQRRKHSTEAGKGKRSKALA